MKVLKFGAIWCPGCLVMRPRWAEIEAELPWLNTIYYDVDQDEEAVTKWELKDTLPVFIWIDADGKEITRLVGEPSKQKIMELIEKYKDR